jgi:hypothetical protein
MGIEGIAEQIEMPFGKHICFRYVTNILTGSVQALMNLTFRWVGVHTQFGNFFANSVCGSQIAIARI